VVRTELERREDISSGCWRWKNINPRIKIFYPERVSAKIWKNILIQGLRFLQLKQTLEIDYFSPIP